MKKNRYLILIVVFLAMVTIVLVLANSRTTFKRSLSDFAVDDTSTITQVFMSDKNNNNVKLTKKTADSWLVNDKYPASKFNIDMLLGTMLHLQVKETVPKPARNNIIKDLASNAVKVEIYQMKYRINLFGKIRLFPREKLTKVYYVGGATQSNRGSYMILENSSEPYVTFIPELRGFVSPIYSPIEKNWRDYSIFKKSYQDILTVRVEFPGNPENSYTIRNRLNQSPELITYPGGNIVEEADTLRMLNFLSSFRKISFEALITEIDLKRKDSILSSTPYCIITLTDVENKSSSITTFRKDVPLGTLDDFGNPAPYDLDRLYALVNNGKDFVLIQYFVFDKILRPKSFFLIQRRNHEND